MKTLYVNGRGEFISIKLKTFYNEKNINLKYIIPYIYKENSFVGKRW